MLLSHSLRSGMSFISIYAFSSSHFQKEMKHFAFKPEQIEMRLLCVCGAYLSHLCLHTVFSFQSTLSLFLSLCLFFSLMLISFLRLFLSIPRLLCNLVLQESLPFFSNVYNLRLEIHVVTEKREII